jgi:hypothetical protein
MQNIKAVRKLLLKPGDIADEQQQAVLDSVFDYLAEEGNGEPESRIRSLMFDLVRVKQPDLSLGSHHILLHQLSPEAVALVVKAMAYSFPDEFQLIPEIALLDFRVYDSTPTIYKEEAGVHAMIIITLLDLADDNGAFNSSDSKFDEHLMALLIEGLQKRYFRNSHIYNHQSSLLSSVLKKFVGRAHGMLPLTKSRWNSLCHIITMSEPLFSGGDGKELDDASLEYVLLNELCFKLFNECSLETKAALLRSHCLSVNA